MNQTILFTLLAGFLVSTATGQNQGSGTSTSGNSTNSAGAASAASSSGNNNTLGSTQGPNSNPAVTNSSGGVAQNAGTIQGNNTGGATAGPTGNASPAASNTAQGANTILVSPQAPGAPQGPVVTRNGIPNNPRGGSLPPARAAGGNYPTVTPVNRSVSYSNGVPPMTPVSSSQAVTAVSAPGTASPVNTYGPAQTAPAQMYSDLEYGQLVRVSQQRAQTEEPVTQRHEGPSVLDMIRTEEEAGKPGIATVRVMDVFDRGIMLLDTHEEMKLRGVDIPTQRTFNDIGELHARRAIEYLQQTVRGQVVYVTIGDPLRGMSGSLLGTVYLSDGTEVNSLMIANGFGKVDAVELQREGDRVKMQLAEAAAREERIGVWSNSLY